MAAMRTMLVEREPNDFRPELLWVLTRRAKLVPSSAIRGTFTRRAVGSTRELANSFECKK